MINVNIIAVIQDFIPVPIISIKKPAMGRWKTYMSYEISFLLRILSLNFGIEYPADKTTIAKLTINGYINIVVLVARAGNWTPKQYFIP